MDESVKSRTYQDKEIRPASIDLTIDDRAYRSLIMTRLAEDQIESLHEYELNVIRFYLLSSMWEIEKAIKVKIDKHKLDLNQRQAVIEFSESCRPEPKKFNGVSVPSYFPLDNTFDGMLYHHDWDRLANLNRHKLEIPISESLTKKSSGKFRGDVDG